MQEAGSIEHFRCRTARHCLATLAYQDTFAADKSSYSDSVRSGFNVIFEDDIFKAAYNLCMEIRILTNTSASPINRAHANVTTESPAYENGPLNDYTKNSLTDTKSYLMNAVNKTLSSLNQRPDLLKGNIKDPLFLSIILVFAKNEGTKEQVEEEARTSVRSLLKSILETLHARKRREQNAQGGPKESLPVCATFLPSFDSSILTRDIQIQEPPTGDQYSPPAFRGGRRQSRRVQEASALSNSVPQDGFVPGSQFDDAQDGSFDPMMPSNDMYQVSGIHFMNSNVILTICMFHANCDMQFQTPDWNNIDMNTLMADFDFDFDFGPMIFDESSSASESLWQQ